MADPPAIDVTHVRKTFGAKTALQDVSFAVPQGAIFGFLGPNGAGKTTTIRCLMDFIRPSGGSIQIFGMDAHTHSTQLKKQVGFLASEMQLNGAWTAAEHMRLAETIRGTTGETARLARLLGLELRPKVKNLSTGNQQKLAIALALIGSPKLLVMDEPTRGLDPVLQNTVYELLQNLAKNGSTVFFSSHNLSEVQRVCSAVALIKDGSIVAEQGMEDIRGANIHIVSVATRQDLDITEIARIKNVESVRIEPHHATVRVTGDINPIMVYFTARQLTDISVDHASLEDIFLAKYKEHA
ncbi:MAG TPA: ABC transporter ATP-binding protein [Candidatus Saccharimonadales bacterium]|nr:ABC transporter ATP-binding protein [Candidatus Saccharimonadales bacterium]